MRELFVLAVLTAISAHASDFRAVDIGGPCTTVTDWELARGSSLVPRKAPGMENYAFRVREFDRTVLATYVCINGKLFTGNYSFPVEGSSQVASSYRAAYTELVAQFGEPSSSDVPWKGADNGVPVLIQASGFMTTWTTERLAVVLSIMPNRPTEAEGWRVFIVVGGQRTRN